MERAPDTLETPRLRLWRPGPGDARPIYERYAGDAEVCRFLSWRRHEGLADTEAFLGFSRSEWERWPAGPYLIATREDGRLIGSTGLGFETPGTASTGYVLARDAWGRGYATEAVGAIVALAPSLGLRRLHALCHTAHRASQRVLEKSGFEREGVLRRHAEFPNLAPGELLDAVRYARAFSGG